MYLNFFLLPFVDQLKDGGFQLFEGKNPGKKRTLICDL